MNDKFPMVRARPAIFDESNREFWRVVYRLLVYIVKELRRWYGFDGDFRE